MTLDSGSSRVCSNVDVICLAGTLALAATPRLMFQASFFLARRSGEPRAPPARALRTALLAACNRPRRCSAARSVCTICTICTVCR